VSWLDSSTITTVTAIGALLLSLVAVVFNAIQVAHLRRELREQTEQSIYDIALEWDRLLIERPDLSDLLANPSDGPLTTQERVLAEYRLDLAELTHRKTSSRLYEAERDFFDRLISIPLLRKALASGAVDKSLKREFMEQLKAALARSG
jgi:hypothetical protein